MQCSTAHHRGRERLLRQEPETWTYNFRTFLSSTGCKVRPAKNQNEVLDLAARVCCLVPPSLGRCGIPPRAFQMFTVLKPVSYELTINLCILKLYGVLSADVPEDVAEEENDPREDVMPMEDDDDESDLAENVSDEDEEKLAKREPFFRRVRFRRVRFRRVSVRRISYRRVSFRRVSYRRVSFRRVRWG
eukprot:gene6367-7099_t